MLFHGASDGIANLHLGKMKKKVSRIIFLCSGDNATKGGHGLTLSVHIFNLTLTLEVHGQWLEGQLEPPTLLDSLSLFLFLWLFFFLACLTIFS